MKTVRYFILALAAIGVLFAVSQLIKKLIVQEPVSQEELVIKGTRYFVAPDGDDAQDGLSENTAFLTIQHALDVVGPGDGVLLADGVYLQDFVTRRDGTAERPIIVSGSRHAVVKGTGEKPKIIEIGHDHYALADFTVDGLEGDRDEKENYRDKLIYVQGSEPLKGVTGLRILDMDIRNAGGECVRLKYFARNNEVARNRITGCGAYDFLFKGGGKNGEGVYIGTAPEQVAKDKNPTQDVDHSDGNRIHDNIIDTQGNECVDIKEGSSGNIVEHNICTGQKDKESAGLDSRGSGNIFRGNEVYGCIGAGIRLGGDDDDDGTDNIVEDNYLHDNGNGGIKIQRNPQKRICGNRLTDNDGGDLVGEYGSENKNKKKCGV